MFMHSFSISLAGISFDGIGCPTAADMTQSISGMGAAIEGNVWTDIDKPVDVALGAVSAAKESEHASSTGGGTRYSLWN